MQLQNKVAIVTGAARGLGRAYAISMAAEGASVLACDVNDCSGTVAEIEAAGGKAVSAITNIGSMDSCNAMAATALDAFGKIDILVNNGALYGSLKREGFETLDEEQWDAVMDINVKGVWRACKAVAEPMRQAGGGSIINITSLAAIFGMVNALDYVVSKAAVIGMSRSLARELGRYNIRVNAVAPTAVMTEGTSEFFGDTLEKTKTAIAANQVIQRNLETRDLTGTIIYLAADSSSFVTGQTHLVDGGSYFL